MSTRCFYFAISQINKKAAVAQKVKWVVQQLEGRWLESLALLAACQSVLELNTKLLLMSKLAAPAINV